MISFWIEILINSHNTLIIKKIASNVYFVLMIRIFVINLAELLALSGLYDKLLNNALLLINITYNNRLKKYLYIKD